MSLYPLAEVDLASIAHNLDVIKKHSPSSKVMAMLSGNAYGHGLIPVVRCLRRAEAFGVDRLSSALKIREENFHCQRVLVTQGVFDAQELRSCVENRLDVVVHSWNQVRDLENVDYGKINVWLKLDLSTHGLGFIPRDFETACGYLRTLSCVNELVLFADLSCPENTDRESVNKTHQEINLFHKLTKNKQEPKSLVGSAGLVSYPEAHYQWVRPEMLLFGVRPPVLMEDYKNNGKFGDVLKFIQNGGGYSQWNLWPAMTLKSRIIAIRNLSKERESSNGFIPHKTQMRIGIIQLGFSDGYPSKVEEGTPVLICGQHSPILSGGIGGNTVTVDLSDLPPDVQVGDEAIFWGTGLAIERIAESANVCPASLLCALGNSTNYKYRNAEYYFSKVWSISIEGEDYGSSDSNYETLTSSSDTSDPFSNDVITDVQE